MSPTPHTPENCRRYRGLLLHLRRGELDPATAGPLREHLAMCEDCRRFDEVDASFDRVLASALRREPLPAALVHRLPIQPAPARRADLAPRIFGMSAASKVLAAAAIFALGMAVPVAVERLRGPAPGRALDVAQVSPVAEIELAGVMVDDECDRDGAPMQLQRRCADPHHHTVLRTGAGEYVALVGADGQDLPVRREHRGLRVRVRGRYDPLAGTMRAAAIERL